MRPQPSQRKQSPAKRLVPRIDGFRALVAAGILLSVCSLVLGVGVVAHFAGSPSSSSANNRSAISQQDAAGRQVGAMVFAPRTGRTCWERRFDYGNEQIVSDRTIECEAKLADDPIRPAGKVRDNTVRIRAIMDDFKKRK